MITARQFKELTPLFLSSDVTRPTLCKPLWYDNYMCATDGRIALAVWNENDCYEPQENSFQIGSSLLRDLMPKLDAKVANGEYLPFDLGLTYSAASAALGDLVWEMDYLKSPVDDDYPEEESDERTVQQSYAAVVLDTPPRQIVSAYYAALLARLCLIHGPATAYSDGFDPHATIYVVGDNWRLFLMPRLVAPRLNPDSDFIFYGTAIGDAATGTLVNRRCEGPISSSLIRFPKKGGSK